jgi:xylan 1,4-beta-xylosidase
MVIAARSRSIHGPWENCPHNPVVRTWSRDEKWWSRGHATLIDGPDGKWWMVYHGYENGYWTLGRQALLDPIEWTDDGWFVARGGDLSQPIPKPNGGDAVPHYIALSDDFGDDKLGTQWSFYDPAPGDRARLSFSNGCLQVEGKGTAPANCSPLSFIVGDIAYEVEVDLEIGGGACGGLLLFYNRRLYCGVGVDERGLVMHRYGLERRVAGLPFATRRLCLRVKNDHHIVTCHYRPRGGAWTRFPVQMEVSGYHHNVAYDFLSLRPALYAAGSGPTRFRQLIYRAL